MANRRSKRDMAEILRPYLLTVIIAVSAMVSLMLVWLVIGDDYRRGSAILEAAAAQSSPLGTSVRSFFSDGSTTVEPESADGSGQAGVRETTDAMKAVSLNAGKYTDETGTWYSPYSGYCYYNGWVTKHGETYHFDSEGYMDTGWTAIAGSGYYFDENGIYDPEKDGSKLIALTFDDGPSAYTSEVLDVLDEYGLQATFMMLGVNIEKNGDVIPRMIEMGNTIGNHSADHANMDNLTTDQVVAQFQTTDNLLAQYGVTSTVVRFPYGNYSKEQVAAVGKPQIFWDVDSLDWESRDPSAIVSLIYEQLQPGSIILMHDIYPETVEALRILIPSLLEDGYEPVNIVDLAASRGYELKAGVTYKGFKQSNIDRGSVTDE